MTNTAQHTDTIIEAIVVDDEALARDLLKTLIAKDGGFDVVAECSDGDAAIAAINANSPDVVFLDIEMPGLNGLDVVRQLGDSPKTPHVVFVTAYDQYAIDAFELNAVDYLVKPLSKERCRETLGRVREIVRNENVLELTNRLLAVVQGIETQTDQPLPEQKLVVKKGDELRAVALSDIIWLEAANQYTKINTSGEQFVMSISLGQLAQRLRDSRFVRIHRSALINGHHVAKVSKNRNGTHEIQLTDGNRVTLARARSGNLERILHLAGEAVHGE